MDGTLLHILSTPHWFIVAQWTNSVVISNLV